jgi:hypothetical protein
VYDPNAGGQQMAQLLEKGSTRCRPTTRAGEDGCRRWRPVARAAGVHRAFAGQRADGARRHRLDEAIRGSEARARRSALGAEGDWEALRRHALNAARKDLGGEKWRYDRPPTRRAPRGDYPIDALTGLLMGHSSRSPSVSARRADRRRPAGRRDGAG